MHRIRLSNLLAVTLVTTTALGLGCTLPGESPDPPPPPQLSLRGQLLASTVTTTPNPLSLAMAWYPAWLGGMPGSPAGAIVTQSATYSGAFPVDFTFEIDGPPPAAAQVDLRATGGGGKAAYGLLIAYEDRNGNGTLDTATASTPSPDWIAGLSMPDPSRPPPLYTHFVVYLDGSVGPDDYLATFKLEQGFNLLAVHRNYGVDVVPPTTSVGIEVTRSDGVQIYACQEADFELGLKIACGIDPFEGGYEINGHLFGWTSPEFEIDDANGYRSDATVKLNGETLTYYPYPAAKYRGGTPVVGTNTLEIDVPGHPTEIITANVPAPVQLTTPFPSSVKSGSALTLQWAPDPAVELYSINVYDANTFRFLFHDNVTGTSVTIDPIHHTGPVRISVLGLAPLAVGGNGGYVTALNRFTGVVNYTQ